jgi:hypothetical protein
MCEKLFTPNDYINPLSCILPWCTYVVILLCLTPDDFTNQGESAGVNGLTGSYLPMDLVNQKSRTAPYFVILL